MELNRPIEAKEFRINPDGNDINGDSYEKIKRLFTPEASAEEIEEYLRETNIKVWKLFCDSFLFGFSWIVKLQVQWQSSKLEL